MTNGDPSSPASGNPPPPYPKVTYILNVLIPALVAIGAMWVNAVSARVEINKLKQDDFSQQLKSIQQKQDFELEERKVGGSETQFQADFSFRVYEKFDSLFYSNDPIKQKAAMKYLRLMDKFTGIKVADSLTSDSTAAAPAYVKNEIQSIRTSLRQEIKSDYSFGIFYIKNEDGSKSKAEAIKRFLVRTGYGDNNIVLNAKDDLSAYAAYHPLNKGITIRIDDEQEDLQAQSIPNPLEGLETYRQRIASATPNYISLFIVLTKPVEGPS